MIRKSNKQVEMALQDWESVLEYMIWLFAQESIIHALFELTTLLE